MILSDACVLAGPELFSIVNTPQVRAVTSTRAREAVLVSPVTLDAPINRSRGLCVTLRLRGG
jgi:hypothetical protein